VPWANTYDLMTITLAVITLGGLVASPACAAQHTAGTTLKRAAVLLYVIDLHTHRVVRAITNLPGIEGVVCVPELKKIYTSNWWENTIGVIDLQQMTVVKKLPTEESPTALCMRHHSTVRLLAAP
jgi:DNA-binding beta-propeller fold protein YncE